MYTKKCIPHLCKLSLFVGCGNSACIYVCEYVHVPRPLLLVFIFLCSFQITVLLLGASGCDVSLCTTCLQCLWEPKKDVCQSPWNWSYRKLWISHAGVGNWTQVLEEHPPMSALNYWAISPASPSYCVLILYFCESSLLYSEEKVRCKHLILSVFYKLS